MTSSTTSANARDSVVGDPPGPRASHAPGCSRIAFEIADIRDAVASKAELRAELLRSLIWTNIKYNDGSPINTPATAAAHDNFSRSECPGIFCVIATTKSAAIRDSATNCTTRALENFIDTGPLRIQGVLAISSVAGLLPAPTPESVTLSHLHAHRPVDHYLLALF
jgi:hypothetical protein